MSPSTEHNSGQGGAPVQSQTESQTESQAQSQAQSRAGAQAPKDRAVRTVALEGRSYDIHIGPGLVGEAAALVPGLDPAQRMFVLTDTNAAPCAAKVEAALRPHCAGVETLVLDPGEHNKSWDGIARVTGWLLDNKLDRQARLIAVGGGVIGDLGGFAASIAMRGIAFAQVPTTLLAQVDSSVGGKTGINTPHGKNLVGSFYQPDCVICDTDTLSSLPEREIRAGYAEIVKYGLGLDAAFFGWLEDNGTDVLARAPEALIRAIDTSCRIKAQIVAEDEREKAGRRALLNLGHTFGHALEAQAGYDGRLLHGEAVAVGMMLAFRLAHKMGLCEGETLRRVAAHYRETGLPADIAALESAFGVPFGAPVAAADATSPQRLYALMQLDKKAGQGRVRFVLPQGIGRSFVTADVEDENVLAVLQESIEGEAEARDA